MKIAVVGGGSTYTPELVSGLSRERERIDVRRARAARHRPGAARGRRRAWRARMLERQGFDGALSVTDDLDRALDGRRLRADPDPRRRAGGAALGRDRAARSAAASGRRRPAPAGSPRRCAPCRSCSRSPSACGQLAAPDAWIVDFTNPVGIVTRALLDAGHRAVGLCNVAIGFQRSIARLLGVEPERVLVDQVGLNHLTWVRAVRLDGDDVAARAARRPRRRARRDGRACRCALLEELGAVPSSYLRYFYAHDEVLAEQRDGVPRAATVAEIERELLRALPRPGPRPRSPPLLEQRGGAFYSEAATGLVASLAAGDGRRARRRRAQRRHARRARRRRRRRGAGARRPRTGPRPLAAAAARARAARPRPARGGVRAAGRAGGA